MKIVTGKSIPAIAALIAVLCAPWIAEAQQTPTTPAPQNGVQGWYYNNPNGPIPPAPNIGSPAGTAAAPNSTILVPVGAVGTGQPRIDNTIDFNDPDDNNRPAGQNVDRFNITWLGTITIGTTGAYWFRAVTDDGGRFWISRTLPFPNNGGNGNDWQDQGDTNIDYPVATGAGITYNAGEKLFFRMEYYENGGGTTARMQWRTPNSGTNYVAIPVFNGTEGFQTPGPCPTPVLITSSVGGAQQIRLDWTVPGPTANETRADSYNIYRGTTAGGARVLVGNTTALTFTDTGAVSGPLAFGTTYYYVVQGVYSAGVAAAAASPLPLGMVFGNPSNESACAVNPFAIAPQTLMAIENGGTGTITITTSAAIPGGTTVSFNIAVAPIGAGPAAFTAQASVSFTGPVAAGGSVSFLVTAVDDNKANLPRSVTVTVGPSTSGTAGWGGHTLPPVTCTTIETDIAGVIITPANGLAITNGGPAITFNVSLSTIPDADVVLTLGSTLPVAATLSPPTITLNAGNWNTGVTVTVTPNNNDTTVVYLTSFYVTFTPVVSIGDANYDGINPGTAYIFMPTSTPPLNEVWGSGGCGLLGLEGVLLLGLIAGLRRRRAA